MNKNKEKAVQSYELVEIGRFVVPDLPTGPEGSETFKLKCVTKLGKQVEYPCTRKAYTDFQKFKPHQRTKVFFYLKVGSDGLVFDYSEAMGPPQSTMFAQELSDGRKIESANRFIFERKVGDKEWEPVFIPDRVTAKTVGAILAALREVEDMDVQDKLLDKYTVYKLAQLANKEEVTLDMGR